MSEDFVTFEIAQKLKEKGFREKCLAYYTPYAGVLRFNTIDVDKRPSGYEMKFAEFYECYNCYVENNIDAPTISQVLKWLREEKGYHIEFIGNACGYLFIVSDIPSKGGTDRYCSDYSGPNDGGTWDTYEEAALAGITYCLDNLI